MKGGFEITFKYFAEKFEKRSTGASAGKMAIDEFVAALCEHRKCTKIIGNEGKEKYSVSVTDSETGRTYLVKGDWDDVVEINTPPGKLSETESILQPIFEATSRMSPDRYSHTFGGGHFHLDLETLLADPVKTLNFLTQFHNFPFMEKLFLPVDGEYTLYERGLQSEMIEAVDELKKKFEKTGELSQKSLLNFMERFFASNTYLKTQSLMIKPKVRTLEIRIIGNQKHAKAGFLEHQFFEKVWNSCPNDRIESAARWTDAQYFAHFDPTEKSARSEFETLMAVFDLRSDDYENFINGWDKTRRRSIERSWTQFSSSNFSEFVDRMKRTGWHIDPAQRGKVLEALKKSRGVETVKLAQLYSAYPWQSKAEKSEIAELTVKAIKRLKYAEGSNLVRYDLIGIFDSFVADPEFIAFFEDAIFRNLTDDSPAFQHFVELRYRYLEHFSDEQRQRIWRYLNSKDYRLFFDDRKRMVSDFKWQLERALDGNRRRCLAWLRKIGT